MKDNYVNIVLVCLDGDFNRSISKELADKLDMFFADLKDYIEYDLIDSKAVLQKCGIDYLSEREYKASENFAKFENAVLTVDFDLFKQNRAAFTRNLVLYIRLTKRQIDKKENINLISYENRDEYLTNNSDMVVQLKSKAKPKAIKEIMLQLQEAL